MFIIKVFRLESEGYFHFTMFLFFSLQITRRLFFLVHKEKNKNENRRMQTKQNYSKPNNIAANWMVAKQRKQFKLRLRFFLCNLELFSISCINLFFKYDKL